jgi:hypothetical protein
VCCGQKPFRAGRNINPDLMRYYDSFIVEGALRGADVPHKDINFYFAPTGSTDQLGFCLYYKTDDDAAPKPSIVIDEQKWTDLTPSGREMLTFHELAHCLLYRDHDNTVIEDGMPATIMNEYAFDYEYYQEHREYYLTELFQ